MLNSQDIIVSLLLCTNATVWTQTNLTPNTAYSCYAHVLATNAHGFHNSTIDIRYTLARPPIDLILTGKSENSGSWEHFRNYCKKMNFLYFGKLLYPHSIRIFA